MKMNLSSGMGYLQLVDEVILRNTPANLKLVLMKWSTWLKNLTIL